MEYEWHMLTYSYRTTISDHQIVQALLHYRNIAPDLREMYELQRVTNGAQRCATRARLKRLEELFQYRTVATSLHAKQLEAINKKQLERRAEKARQRQSTRSNRKVTSLLTHELIELANAGNEAATVALEDRRLRAREIAKKRLQDFKTIIAQYESGHAVHMGQLDRARRFFESRAAASQRMKEKKSTMRD